MYRELSAWNLYPLQWPAEGDSTRRSQFPWESTSHLIYKNSYYFAVDPDESVDAGII